MVNEKYVHIKSISDFEKVKYGDSFYFYCKRCGRRSAIKSYRPFRLKTTYANFLCKRCGMNLHSDKEAKLKKTKMTNLRKYGCECVLSSESVKNKISETNIKRYGYSNPTKNKTVSEKISKALNNKSEAEWKEIKQKAKQTCVERYGKDWTALVYNKVKKTRLDRYGTEHPQELQTMIDKTKATKLQRYGDERYVNIEKMRKTKLSKYGNEFFTNREKAKQTCVERYGTEYPMKTNDIKNNLSHNRERISFYL